MPAISTTAAMAGDPVPATSRIDHDSLIRKVAWRLMPLVMICYLSSIPAFWALPPRLLAGAGPASGIALISTLGQLGGIVGPVLAGRIKDLTGSTTPALHVIGAASIVCAILVVKALPAAAMKAARGR